MATTIKYHELLFENKELTQIEGKLTADHLIRINKELKSNALSVYSSLGGARHGHLFLVMTTAQFALILAVPFVHPNHPRILVIPPGTTQHMTTTWTEQHKEDICLFREVKGVEKALVQTIVKAIWKEYLNSLRNCNTTSITGPFYNIIDHLSMMYGSVTAQMFEKEEEVRKMTYNPTHSIGNIFTALDDLVDFAKLTHNNITQRQCVTRAYLVLNRSGQFIEAINAWNCRLPAQQN